MSKVIIYNQESGVVAVVYPTQEALDLYGIDAIAEKDVPTGVPYAIIDENKIPKDRMGWRIDSANLTDGIGL